MEGATGNLQRIDIDNLKPGEQIQLVLKRHWIVFVYTGFYAFILLVTSIFILAYQSSIISIFPSDLFYVFLIFYWSIFLLFIYVDWINNELDLFIITNKRVIGLEQVSFLNRTVSECGLDDIQEVNGQTKGLLANILNFGTVTIHTSSEKSDFNMDIVPAPLENARNINNLVQDHRAHEKHPHTPSTAPVA